MCAGQRIVSQRTLGVLRGRVVGANAVVVEVVVLGDSDDGGGGCALLQPLLMKREVGVLGYIHLDHA